MLKTNPHFAIVFPGQGSQSIGMLSELASHYSEIQKTFDTASQVLGYDLWQLTQTGPEEQLNQTKYTQPALLAADIAVWQVMQQNLSCSPAFLAGHSLGEYSALVAAQAIEFKEAIRLVQLRGQLMQQAAPENSGAMAAIIGLEDNVVEQLCQSISNGTDYIVAPANFNGTGQVVIAGHKSAVETAIESAKAQGARLAKLIPVSVPAHSFFMQTIATAFDEALQNIAIQSPTIPVIQNVDATTHQDPNDIKRLLVKQLYSPVQWTNTLHFFEQHQISLLAEAGPGKVLTGLAKRTTPQIQCLSINTQQNLVELQLQLTNEA